MSLKPGRKDTIKARKKSLKERIKEKLKGGAAKAATAVAALALLAVCAGCQSSNPAQTTNPASRLTQAEYGDIYASITGDSNTVTFTIGDGAIADASGGGDAQSTGQHLENTPTQTITPTTTITIPTGGSGLIDGAAANGLNSLLGGNKINADEAKAITDCVNGNCGPD